MNFNLYKLTQHINTITMSVGFKIPFDNFREIDTDKNLYILALDESEKYIIFKSDDAKLFATSDVCKKLCVEIDSSELKDITSESSIEEGKIQLIKIDEYYKNLKFGFISEIDDFIDKLAIVDKYCMCFRLFTTEIKYTTWLTYIKESVLKWHENTTILSNVDEGAFRKWKFVGKNISTAPGATNYPTSRPPKVKKIIFRENKKTNPEMKEKFYRLAATLQHYNLKKLLNRFIYYASFSMDYCDSIFNNGKLLKHCPDYPPKLLVEALQYTMRLLYLEETSAFNKAEEDDRYIFNYEDIYLPDVNTAVRDLGTLCYIPLVSGKPLRGYLSHTAFIEGDRGIAENAKERFDIFTGGYLREINYNYKISSGKCKCEENTTCVHGSSSVVKSAITGSIIPACVFKGVLENKYESYEDYINEYYPFWDRKSVKSELDAEEDYYIEDDCSGLPTGSPTGLPTGEDKSEILAEEVNPYKNTADIDIVIETTDKNIFDLVAKDHFENIKKFTDREIKFEKVITENAYKYKISGLHREIDIFMASSIPGVINKFHLACVRGWYNGETFKLFTSAVCAAYSSINCDIRWVSCNKDIRDIVLKYFKRGFGTLLNDRDSKNIDKFISNNPKYSDIKTEQYPWLIRPNRCGRFGIKTSGVFCKYTIPRYERTCRVGKNGTFYMKIPSMFPDSL